MKRIGQLFFKLYLRTTSSIAFYPSIISLGGLLTAFLLLILEDSEMTKFLLENFPYLVINNADTARAILTTLIGGILSLTVFSFSMVMILLNQASSNFSPRLLPGLISDRRNQIVLGVYLGTILYNIIVLISINSSELSGNLNGFSVLMGIIQGVICMGMFVFFIHTISTGIQINNILQRIFDRTTKRLEYLIENFESHAYKAIGNDKKDWNIIIASSATYFTGVNLAGLKQFAKKNNTNIYISPIKGEYILPGTELIKYDAALGDEEVKLLESYLVLSNSTSDKENFVLGIKQISEVGVKAMSPGINDPGTAVMTVDYLSHLFALRMKIGVSEVYQVDDNLKVELNTISFSELLFVTLAAYRVYCKHDVILMRKLVQMLKYLRSSEACDKNYKEQIQVQLDIVEQEFLENITNKADVEYLKKSINS